MKAICKHLVFNLENMVIMVLMNTGCVGGIFINLTTTRDPWKEKTITGAHCLLSDSLLRMSVGCCLDCQEAEGGLAQCKQCHPCASGCDLKKWTHICKSTLGAVVV